MVGIQQVALECKTVASLAVQCAGGGWVIKPGCCSGYMRCDAMNPCNGQQFICHGGLCDPES